MEDIKRAICLGKRLVKSSGNIVKKGDLICVSCTSMVEMSGSPACIIENGEYKVVGILVRGAFAPFQTELIRILACIKRSEVDQGVRFLNEVINSLGSEKYSDIRGLRDFISLIGIKNKYAFTALLDFYLSLLPTYAQIDDPSKTNHNLILSITSTAMRKAVSTSAFLSNFERR